MMKAKALVTKAGKAVANEAMTLGKDVVQSKHFKDAVKGAGVGAAGLSHQNEMVGRYQSR
jgi:hypothetical protein